MRKVIKNQKYQTCAEVRAAASHSEEVAIKSSIRHWNELATAPIADLYVVVGISIAECALCERAHTTTAVCVGNCAACALYKKLGCKCFEPGGVYSTASHAMQSIADDPCSKRKYVAVKRFRRAADKMIKLLESCLENEQ